MFKYLAIIPFIFYSVNSQANNSFLTKNMHSTFTLLINGNDCDSMMAGNKKDLSDEQNDMIVQGAYGSKYFTVTNITDDLNLTMNQVYCNDYHPDFNMISAYGIKASFTSLKFKYCMGHADSHLVVSYTWHHKNGSFDYERFLHLPQSAYSKDGTTLYIDTKDTYMPPNSPLYFNKGSTDDTFPLWVHLRCAYDTQNAVNQFQINYTV